MLQCIDYFVTAAYPLPSQLLPHSTDKTHY